MSEFGDLVERARRGAEIAKAMGGNRIVVVTKEGAGVIEHDPEVSYVAGILMGALQTLPFPLPTELESADGWHFVVTFNGVRVRVVVAEAT